MSANRVLGESRSARRILCLLLAAAVLAGCGPGGPLGKRRKGLITMGPHITETVFALGQGQRVIAVGSYDDYPPAVWRLPKVGGYIDPDLEKITALAPEKLIVAGKQPRISEYAEVNGLPVLNIYMDSLKTIDQGIAELGLALRCVKQASRLRSEIENGLQEVRDAVKDLPRPKVLIIVGRQAHDLDSLPTAGGASFVSELVDVAGGDNIYKDKDRAYFEASKETIVMAAPDTILEFHCGESLSENQRNAYYQDWHALPTLPAVQMQHIHLILEPHGLRPGPRVVEIARLIARLLHSEVVFAS